MEKQLNALIIDDNESDVALIIRHFKKADYNVAFEVVETADQMELALQKLQWDVIICDFTLPQLNAIKALELFKAKGLDIPFIVVSGTIGEETAVEIMKAGANDYIMKDNLARLVPVIQREITDTIIRKEHKQAEEKIRIQAHLLDLIGQSVIMVDKNHTITYWNKASEELYGWSAQEVIGRKFKEVLTIFPLQSDSHDNMSDSSHGKNWSKESNVKKKDGSFIPVHVNHTPIFDEDRSINGIIGISFDISERKKNEEGIIQKMEELASSNEELKRLNRLTIGREMRMIEIKQHCNNLAIQLGINKLYPLDFLNETDQIKD